MAKRSRKISRKKTARKKSGKKKTTRKKNNSKKSTRKKSLKKKPIKKKKISSKTTAYQEKIKKHIEEECCHQGSKGEFLGEFVYGAIDGTITTFAVVAGVAGASLSSGIVIILGFANLFADGFSMACSNYLSQKANRAYISKQRSREEYEVDTIPEAEREEVKQIYYKKGFRGKDLDKVVSVITSNKKVWIDTMMTEELGLLADHKKPLSTSLVTFFGFLAIGFIPLLSYVLSYVVPFFAEHTFKLAVCLTLVALAIIGAIKSYVAKKSLLKSALETVLVGGVAATIAYYIGHFLRWVVTL